MGIGFGSGDNRAEDAAKQAVSSPLLETSIDGAQGILFNITAGRDITLHECEKAAEIVKASADPNANIIFGVVNDDRMQGEVKITVIAAGFGNRMRKSDTVPTTDSVPGFAERLGVSVGEKRPQFGSDEEDLNIPAFLRNRQ
jgi:cell division protein FtsZ